MIDTKSKIIESIIITTKADGSKHFDHLNDQSKPYLAKLLKVCNLLKNAV